MPRAKDNHWAFSPHKLSSDTPSISNGALNQIDWLASRLEPKKNCRVSSSTHQKRAARITSNGSPNKKNYINLNSRGLPTPPQVGIKAWSVRTVIVPLTSGLYVCVHVRMSLYTPHTVRLVFVSPRTAIPTLAIRKNLTFIIYRLVRAVLNLAFVTCSHHALCYQVDSHG